MSTWRKEKGRWSRSFRRRPCSWWSHDTCLTSQPEETEAFATVDTPVVSKKRISFWCKVDTGAGGNVMPLWAFAKFFPNRLTKTGMSTGLQKCNTKLRAYSRTNIPQLSPLDTTITWKDEETKEVNKTDTTFYIADTPGPEILGLLTSTALFN